jgi:aminoglycoside phosphotransferase (APT) family kinase protein
VLSKSDVVPYLVGAGLLAEDASARGDIRVADVSRRNNVFIVRSEHSPAYVLKQGRSREDPGIAREAAVLRALGSLDARLGLRRFVPALVTHDARRQVLVLETVPGARDLDQHYRAGRFSKALARASGHSLALLHSRPPDSVGARPEGLDPSWPLAWHRPWLDELRELSAVGAELLRLTQASKAMCDGLDELRESWRAESLIHGDARWENWIALPALPSQARTRVVVVDWELAGGGDPALDVGAVMGEYLLAWLESIPVVDGRDPWRLLHHARLPLHRLRPSLGVFWSTYQQTSRGYGEGRSLRRTVRFAAVRLIQAAVEQARDSSQLRARMLLAMQLALNLLERPDETAERVLGLAQVESR